MKLIFSLCNMSGTPQRVLSSFLHSFLDSGRGGIPFHPAPLPLLGLSEGDKQCIRDRSSIMARHLFADKSEEFIDAQVRKLVDTVICFTLTSFSLICFITFCEHDALETELVIEGKEREVLTV